MVDSWAWIEYFRGSAAGSKVRRILEESEEEVVVSTINLAEVYLWVLKFYGKKTAKEKLAAIEQRSFVREVDRAIAIEAAQIKHERGWGLADAIVYATAVREKARILTGNPDFRGLDNVEFIG